MTIYFGLFVGNRSGNDLGRKYLEILDSKGGKHCVELGSDLVAVDAALEIPLTRNIRQKS